MHDRREEPIGRSKWQPNLAAYLPPREGSVATYVNYTDDNVPADIADYTGKCVIDCDTGEKLIRRSRHCECLPSSRTKIISNNPDSADYDADFDVLCQPCGPPEDKVRIDRCTTNPCTVENPQTDTDDFTADTNIYFHWQCCGTTSTAIRVSTASTHSFRHTI